MSPSKSIRELTGPHVARSHKGIYIIHKLSQDILCIYIYLSSDKSSLSSCHSLHQDHAIINAKRWARYTLTSTYSLNKLLVSSTVTFFYLFSWKLFLEMVNGFSDWLPHPKCPPLFLLQNDQHSTLYKCI